MPMNLPTALSVSQHPLSAGCWSGDGGGWGVGGGGGGRGEKERELLTQSSENHCLQSALLLFQMGFVQLEHQRVTFEAKIKP